MRHMRADGRPSSAGVPSSPPPDIEVFAHRAAGIAEVMGETLMRAAHSQNIKERRDFSCAVFTPDGSLIAQAAHIPVHLGALEASVGAATDAFSRLGVGDVVILNDPFSGGSHLPDLTTVSAVFRMEPSAAPEVVAYLATRAHHSDLGGSAPGSMAGGRDLVSEGLVVPPVLLVEAGRLASDIVRLICANSRTPDERRADLDAQIAAHRAGEARLHELVTDTSEFAADCAALMDYAELSCTAALTALGNGRAQFRDALDDDGADRGPVWIEVAVELADGQLKIDFTGTDPQVAGHLNAPLAVTKSAVYYVVACLSGGTPVNGGMFRAVEIVAPVGSLVNPRPGAAVAGGNVETSQRIVDTVLGALAIIAPRHIPAASQGTMNNLMLGGFDPARQAPFAYYETLPGGAGGAFGAAGASAIQIHMTNTRNTPIEALESELPLRVLSLAIRRQSHGTGAWPGGDGIERVLELLGDARLSLLAERRVRRPWGLSGGGSGAAGEAFLIRDDALSSLPTKGIVDVAAGDLVVVRTPGGGGWGVRESPLDTGLGSPEGLD
jgi:N-methylhydantoinase B